MSMKDELIIELYKMFRREIDEICIPEIVKFNQPQLIEDNGELYGLLCASPDYIDCIYIFPKYRRKGVARKAVIKHWEQHKNYDMRLHIIHKNEPALKFWNSIFKLELIGENEVDGLYRIKGVK